MAAVLSHPSALSTFSQLKSQFKLPHPRTLPSPLQSGPILTKPKFFLQFRNFSHPSLPKIYVTRDKSDTFLEEIENEESLLRADGKPVKFLLWVLLWASVSIGLYAFSGDAKAAAASADSIRTSGFGVKAANALRASGWPDETVLSILGNIFRDAVAANFVGVVSAGLLVNLLVNIGLKYAILTGVILFITSTLMWSFLCSLMKSLSIAN